MNLRKNQQGFTRQDFAKRDSGGFTLMEVMTAVFVITIGIVGVVGTIQQVVAFNRILTSRLIGAYLAQEGIEIVRNIRDTNWLEGSAWDDGLDAGDYEAEYNDDYLTSFSGEGRYLKIEGGFYKYSAGGLATSFKRKITISDKTADSMRVKTRVWWEEGDNIHDINVQENLYNWFE